MNKIICGFAGIGKSYLAINKERFVDLESTPFQKNWDLYSDVAIHMQKNGYTPMLSCHKELRELLKQKGADYVVVLPEKDHKDNYLERYRQRGNNADFIKLLDENFEKWIEEIETTEDSIKKIPAPNWTLADIINNLK
jgi:hypothetical protein